MDWRYCREATADLKTRSQNRVDAKHVSSPANCKANPLQNAAMTRQPIRSQMGRADKAGVDPSLPRRLGIWADCWANVNTFFCLFLVSLRLAQSSAGIVEGSCTYCVDCMSTPWPQSCPGYQTRAENGCSNYTTLDRKRFFESWCSWKSKFEPPILHGTCCAAPHTKNRWHVPLSLVSTMVKRCTVPSYPFGHCLCDFKRLSHQLHVFRSTLYSHLHIHCYTFHSFKTLMSLRSSLA